jgi:hypothetical protein
MVIWSLPLPLLKFTMIKTQANHLLPDDTRVMRNRDHVVIDEC